MFNSSEELQSAVTIISGILILFGTSGLGGMALIFFRLGRSRQQTISTLKQINQRLIPLENWRERRGDYMTRAQCERFHSDKQNMVDERVDRLEADVTSLQENSKELFKTMNETKLLVVECLAEIRVRNEKK